MVAAQRESIAVKQTEANGIKCPELLPADWASPLEINRDRGVLAPDTDLFDAEGGFRHCGIVFLKPQAGLAKGLEGGFLWGCGLVLLRNELCKQEHGR